MIKNPKHRPNVKKGKQSSTVFCPKCKFTKFRWDANGLMYCDKCGAPLILNGVHQSM